MLMLHLTEVWRRALDETKVVGIIFIDFKKAFDSISHEIMALKLQACGISGSLYNLIMDYLMNRNNMLRLRVRDLIKRKLHMECHKGLS